MRQALRHGYAGFQRLSFNGKVGIVALLYNSVFGTYFVAAYLYKKNQQAEALYRQTETARRESDDWLCYNTAKQYRQECVPMELDGEVDSDECLRLVDALESCRQSLYHYISVARTPAMQPMVRLRNKPDWLREPDWVKDYYEGSKPSTQNDLSTAAATTNRSSAAATTAAITSTAAAAQTTSTQ